MNGPRLSGGVMVRVSLSDLWSSSHGFDSQSPVSTLGKLFTPICFCHQLV